jgi:uncharacterized membrane protein YkvA (DUF1232 family)
VKAVPKNARDKGRAARPTRPASSASPARPLETERDRPREVQGSPRTGAKRTVVGYISELPRFLRLLWGLVTDARVSMVDKLLVAGAIAYIVTPIDFIPDFIPFLGEVDDVFLLVVALRRLMQNAGRTVLLAHWTGDPGELRDLNLRKALLAAAFFLPRRVRRRLRVLGKG